jgi:hypothetical protein
MAVGTPSASRAIACTIAPRITIPLLAIRHKGHGIGSTRTQLEKERTDIYSFILWQIGVKDFQPTAP